VNCLRDSVDVVDDDAGDGVNTVGELVNIN